MTNVAFYPQQTGDMLLNCSTDPADPPFMTFGCAVDHYEACALGHMGCIGGCRNGTRQMMLFDFLSCFEGNASPLNNNTDWPPAKWIDFLEPCAKHAGLDHAAIETCVNGGIGPGSALATVNAEIEKKIKQVRPPTYPWVTVGDVPLGSKNYETCLLHSICSKYKASGGTLPASCSMSKPVGCY
jgi:hypothetical protein